MTRYGEQALTGLVARGLSWWLRHVPGAQMHEWLCESVARPYINWRAGTLIRRMRDGSRIACDLADVIGQKLFYFGVWEPHITAYIRRHLGPDDLFLDVGANIGVHSLTASRLCREVVAVEASPIIGAALRRNIALNGATNIRVINLAVGAETGETVFYRNQGSNCGKSSLFADRVEAASRVEERVRIVPLSSVIGDNEAQACRLIKIDVEGAEYPILLDILANIDRFADNVEVLVEIADESVRNYGGSLDRFLAQFEARGFYPYIVQNTYKDEEYFEGQPVRPPERLTATPAGQFDLVLSRRNTAYL